MNNLHVEVPSSYRGASSSALRVQSEAGSMTYLLPKQPLKEAPYCVDLPGFTGDALTHKSFNCSALANGFGVLCVTPKWSNSTQRVRDHVASLQASMSEFDISEKQPYFVRGVSFGCDLSLVWLKQMRQESRKIAWITPCSAKYLQAAGKLMGLTVVDDAESIDFRTESPIWVQELAKDSVVSKTDHIFLSASRQLTRIQLNGSNHFDAGELHQASVGVAEWFRTGL